MIDPQLKSAIDAFTKRVTQVSATKPDPVQFQVDVLGALQEIPLDRNPDTVRKALAAIWNDFGLGAPDWN